MAPHFPSGRTAPTAHTAASSAAEALPDDPVRAAQNLLIQMEENHVWPNGARDLWADAHGLLLLESLGRAGDKGVYLEKALRVVDAVGTPPHIEPRRAVEEPARAAVMLRDRIVWALAASRVADAHPDAGAHAVDVLLEARPALEALVRTRDAGPGVRLLPVAVDAVCPAIDATGLEALRTAVGGAHLSLDGARFEDDAALGTLLWLAHVGRDRPWSDGARTHCLRALDLCWQERPGAFGARVADPTTWRADRNHLIAIGLQAHAVWPERVARLMGVMADHRSDDRLDILPATHVLRAAAVCPRGHIRERWGAPRKPF